MTDMDIVKLIDHLLEEYINHETRLQFDMTVQKNTILVNRGLTKACEIIINDFGHDKDALAKYAKGKLSEVISSGIQKAHVHNPGDINE